MTAYRKAKAEIDAQIKKVKEVFLTLQLSQKFEEFDETYEKVKVTTNPTIRARLEEEFKKQNKALVR